MQIILNDGETIDSVTINGYTWQVYPSDITQMSDGRRVASLFGNRPATRRTADLSRMRIASSVGGSILDQDGIIVGGAA